MCAATFLASASLSLCWASPTRRDAPVALWPVPGQSNGPGVLPVSVPGSPENLGVIDSVNVDPYGTILRDLGFSGVISGKSLWTFGDTFRDNSSEEQVAYSPGSAAYGNVSQINKVYDTLGSGPNHGTTRLIYPNATELDQDSNTLHWAFGSTQMVEFGVGSGNGLCFYLVNHRPTGIDNILGAGVAHVNVPADDAQITTTRPSWTWNAADPAYGGQFALVDNGFVYGYGRGLVGDSKFYTFVARAPTNSAFVGQDSWTYWNGQTWQGEPTSDFSAAVFPANSTKQGSIFWSNHYNCYMIVTQDNSLDNHIKIRTSSHPVTGWSDDVVVYHVERPSGSTGLQGYIYAPVGHPEYDDSGKTLYITYTLDPNKVTGLVVTFK